MNTVNIFCKLEDLPLAAFNKISLLIITLIFFMNSASAQSNFERGFDAGYGKGYCQNQGIGCIAQLPPIAPLPEIGENFDSYQDGYNRGFEMGLSEQNRKSSNRQRYKTSSAEPLEYIERLNTKDIYALAKILKEAKGKAFELSEEGNYQGCIDLAKAGLRVSPNDAEFLMLIGNGFLKLRNYNDALTYLKKAAKFNSGNGLYNLIINVEDGSYQKKIEEKEKTAIVEQPEKKESDLQTEIHQNLESENYIKALELTNKLVKQESSWQSYSLRGHIQFALKNYSECIADYTKSISINPTSNSYFIRALAKGNLEDFYGVLNDYDKIIESGVPPEKNDMGTMYNNKAYTLVKLKKLNEALPLANKAIELNSSKWYIWDTRGEIYFQLGNYKKCIEDMTNAISIKADQNSFFFRGLAKIKMGDKTNGCQDLSKSGELGNSNVYSEIKKNCGE